MHTLHLTTRALILGALLILPGTLSACGSDQEKAPALQAVGSDQDDSISQAGVGSAASLLDGLPQPAMGDLVLPVVEGIDGGLVFVQGDELYRGWFDGGRAARIAENVNPALFEPSPDGRALAYSSMKDVSQEFGNVTTTYQVVILAIINLDTLGITPTIDIDERFSHTPGILPGWAPTGAAIFSFNQDGLFLIRADQPVAQPVSGTQHAAWLTDGSALLFDTAGDAVPGDEQSPLALYHFDPATGERTRLDITIDDPASADFMLLEPALYAMGLVYDETFIDYHRAALLPDDTRVYIDWPLAVKQGENDLCGTWQIKRQPRTETTPPDVIYTVDDTTFLTDLAALPDGSLVFLKWTLAGCQFTGAMGVELLRLVPGEQPTVIADQIDPGYNANPNEIGHLGTIHGRKYAISPDGRILAWIGGGTATGTSSIYLTDLQTGGTALLLTDSAGSHGFESVTWVPGP